MEMQSANICALQHHHIVHMRQYFWLNGEILQNKYFQYFDRSKTRDDQAKIGLTSQHVQPPFKNYFEPCCILGNT